MTREHVSSECVDLYRLQLYVVVCNKKLKLELRLLNLSRSLRGCLEEGWNRDVSTEIAKCKFYTVLSEAFKYFLLSLNFD